MQEPYPSPHPHEIHKSHRSNWLRAAVLGVNDGVVSTSSIMLGVLAAQASGNTIITTGVAALAAGALSMAMGEYVSVSSQLDAEQADMDIERKSLKDNPQAELEELARIYMDRGLDESLAHQVAARLHQHDALAAHGRDELGIDADAMAKPGQAALASAVAFSVGALVPLAAAVLYQGTGSAWGIIVSSLAILGISGALGARVGGGHKMVAATRVLIGGGLAMAITAVIGRIVGVTL